MKFIFQTEDQFYHYGIHFVKSCEKLFIPTYMGYKFDSNCYSIGEKSKLCVFCQKREKKKKKIQQFTMNQHKTLKRCLLMENS